MPRDVIVPIRPLDLATPDLSVADGVLRRCENLVPRPAPNATGRDRGLYLQPAAPATELGGDLKLGSDIVAAAWHVRQARGKLDQTGGSLERLVVVTTSDVFIVDLAGDGSPDAAPSVFDRYTFAADDPSRKAQFAQVGDTLFVACSVASDLSLAPAGRDQGRPEVLLAVVDDAVFAYDDSPAGRAPDPDRVTLVTNFVAPGERGLPGGHYAYRLAHVLRDGTIGPATAPYFFQIDPFGGTTYQVQGVATADNEILVTGTACLDEIQPILALDGTTRVQVDGVGLTNQVYEIVAAYEDSGNTVLVRPEQNVGSKPTSGDVLLERQSSVRFTRLPPDISGPLPPATEALGEGVAVYLADRVQEGEGVLTGEGTERAFASTYHRVADLLGTGSEATFAGGRSDIIAAEPYDEGSLAALGVAAATVTSYNARLVLGDVRYTFPTPGEDGVLHVATSGTEPFTYVRIGVVIQTQNGTYERIGEPVACDAVSSNGAKPFVVPFETIAAYPDRRAKELRIYWATDTEPGGLSDPDGDYELFISLPLTPSATLNAAYVTGFGTNTAFGPDGSTDPMPDPAAANARTDYDPNRILVSGTFRPFEINAAAAYYVGESNEDRVLGIAPTARPVSRGQYGDFPLFVLCSSSVWAFGVSAGLFTDLVPISVERGVVGRYAFCNAEGRVVFAAADGLYTLPYADETPFSAPLVAPADDTTSGFLSLLDADTALGYYHDAGKGRREVWVAAGRPDRLVPGPLPPSGRAPEDAEDAEARSLTSGRATYAYGLDTGAWFTMTRARSFFVPQTTAGPVRPGGLLIGAEGETLYDEAGTGTADADAPPVPVRIAFAPIRFGDPGRRKRLRRLAVRHIQPYVDQPDAARAGALRITVEEAGSRSTPPVTLVDGPLNPDYPDRPINIQRGHVRAVRVAIEGEVDRDLVFTGLDFELYSRAAGRSRPRVFS